MKQVQPLIGNVREALKPYEAVNKAFIPVFAAGGVFAAGDCKRMLDAGASGVQIGTRFIATEECDASKAFKDVIIGSRKEDIVIIKSPVGMPARAVKTPLLERLADGEEMRVKSCSRCLKACPGPAKTVYCT